MVWGGLCASCFTTIGDDGDSGESEYWLGAIDILESFMLLMCILVRSRLSFLCRCEPLFVWRSLWRVQRSCRTKERLHWGKSQKYICFGASVSRVSCVIFPTLAGMVPNPRENGGFPYGSVGVGTDAPPSSTTFHSPGGDTRTSCPILFDSAASFVSLGHPRYSQAVHLQMARFLRPIHRRGRLCFYPFPAAHPPRRHLRRRGILRD